MQKTSSAHCCTDHRSTFVWQLILNFLLYRILSMKRKEKLAQANVFTINKTRKRQEGKHNFCA